MLLLACYNKTCESVVITPFQRQSFRTVKLAVSNLTTRVSINQSIDRSVGESITSINQSINQSITSINQPINHFNQPINQPINSINQSFQLINQSINKSITSINQAIQYNTIQSNLFQLSYMSIIIIIHCILLNEKSKRICRKLNKLIRDIPRITHNQFT